MEEVLTALGATPKVIEMVLASETMMTIYEDLDLQWRILSETSIKAMSIRGYKTKNFMMTGNKFAIKVPKPELLEDWDPRVVVTTLTLDESAGFGMERLILDQVAEKDLLHRADSRAYIEGDGPDQIKVSIIVFQRDQKPIRGFKVFTRYNNAFTTPLSTTENPKLSMHSNASGLNPESHGIGGGSRPESRLGTGSRRDSGSRENKKMSLMVPTSVGRKMSCPY